MAKISIPIKVDGIDCIIRVIKDVVDEANFKEDVSDDYKNGVYDFSNALIKTLETLKDGDFVQQGHWIYGEFDIPHCSECGHQIMPNKISPYCPNCGARMDGGNQ